MAVFESGLDLSFQCDLALTKFQPERPHRGYSIASVDRAIDVLEALARVGPATLTDLAEAAGHARPAVFRVLRTMEAKGYAIQDGARGAWSLGARICGVGAAAADQGTLAAVASPHLEALSRACGEASYLRVRDGLESRTVAAYRLRSTQRLYTTLGERGPLHAGPSRLLLAYAPETIREQVLGLRLPKYTPHTRTDPVSIRADIERIRTRGYLVTSEEIELGVVSIGAPVRDMTQSVVATVFIFAVARRLRSPRTLVSQVVEVAADISVALGAIMDLSDTDASASEPS